jgi:DNA repair photolyase
MDTAHGDNAMELVPRERKPRVLVPAKLPCLGGIPTVHLTARADLLEGLNADLAHSRRVPEAIYFGPPGDLFAADQLRDLAYDVLDLVLGQGIGVVLGTKGRIPKRHLDLLAAHAPLVRAEIGLVTREPALARMFEPHAASFAVRLNQMRYLIDHGVATRARLDPILPGLGDDPDALHDLCAALAAAGVTEISAATLFLRPVVLAALRRAAGKGDWSIFRPTSDTFTRNIVRKHGPVPFRPPLPIARRRIRRLLAAFERGQWTVIRASRTPVLMLPAARRRKIFDWLGAIARQYSMTLHVCGCKDPEAAAGSCRLAEGPAGPCIPRRQLPLFVS